MVMVTYISLPVFPNVCRIFVFCLFPSRDKSDCLLSHDIINQWDTKLNIFCFQIQFCLTIVHIGSLLIIKDCEYPRWIALIFLPQDLFMLILFTDFYIKTYVIKKDKKKADNCKIQNQKLQKEDIQRLINNEMDERDSKRKNKRT